MKYRWIPICLALVALSCYPSQEETPWPTNGWPVSTPGEQGMDPGRLSALDASLATDHGNIDGMLVIRNGRIVYEANYERDYDAPFDSATETPGPYNYHDPEWHPYYQRGPLHSVQSVTKSVTSALIGIAIGRGEIDGVDVRVIDFLDGYEVAHLDERKKSMTLGDILTMRTGIEWDEESVPYTDPANSCAGMEGSDDWVQFVVERPMSHQPGEFFNYNSGASHLLSLIIKVSTGKYVDEYAAEHLFGPLGITEFFWKKTPRGFPDTEGGLYLRPRDLAKIGYLYAMDGIWDGVRILPEGWVQASVKRSVEDTGWAGNGYGYQWWLIPWGSGRTSYAWTADGYGGQLLFVVPEYDVIAVFTGWNVYETPSLDEDFALGSVLEAVKVAEDS